MQLDIITEKHYSYLYQTLCLDKTRFCAICNEGESAIASLLDQLYDLRDQEWDRLFETNQISSETNECISELIEIIEGPYEEEPDAHEDHVVAHQFSIYNKPQLEASTQCGCFYCLKIFPPEEITDWIDPDEDTALCPYCGIDSVIGNASGYEISEAFMKKMKERWF